MDRRPRAAAACWAGPRALSAASMLAAVGMRLRAGCAPWKNSWCAAASRPAAAEPAGGISGAGSGGLTSGGSWEASGGGVVDEESCSCTSGTPRFRLSSLTPAGTATPSSTVGSCLVSCALLLRLPAGGLLTASAVSVSGHGAGRAAAAPLCPSWAATAASTLQVSAL